jgi:hypothetical protein
LLIGHDTEELPNAEPLRDFMVNHRSTADAESARRPIAQLRVLFDGPDTE